MLKKEEYFELIKQRKELFINQEDYPIQILINEKDIKECEKTIQNEIGIVYHDKYLYLIRDAIKFQNGEYGSYLRFINEVDSNNSIVVLPIIYNKNDKKTYILLEKHFRHASRQYLYEFPRGFGNSNLSVEENVLNELEEEIGLNNHTFIKNIGKIYPDSGLFEKYVNVYIVEYQLNKNEFIFNTNDDYEGITEFKVISKEKLFELIASNKITDGFTLSTIMLAISKGII